jgi:serine/threonine protein kinase
MKQVLKKVKDYELIKCLGSGTFGEVYLTENEKNHKQFATKVIPTSFLKRPELKKYIDSEIKIMKQLDHENTIKLHEFFQTNNNLYFIMEYINGGTLSDYLSSYKLKTGKPFSQKMIQHFVKQIVQGLIYIHSKNIIHRDLKLDNILLSFPSKIPKENREYSQATVKIIDFGLSTQKTFAMSNPGTPAYMDPIILQKFNKSGGIKRFRLYDKKADIWSLGAITYEMLTGQNIFQADDLDELISKVEKGNYYLKVDDLSNEILSFLNCMLQYEPKNRLSAKDLALHQFLTEKPEDFEKADVSDIEYKINEGFLTINIFNNNTIKKMFPYKPNNIFNSLTLNMFQLTKKNNHSKKDISTQNDKNKLINIGKNDQVPIKEEEDKKNPTNKNIDNFIDSLNDIPETTSIKLANDKKDDEKIILQPNLKRGNTQEYFTNNDELTPLPINSYKSGEIKSKTAEYKVQFQVKRIDNRNEDINLTILLLVNEKKILKKEVNLSKANGFLEKWIWNFNSNDWKNIDINNENFIMKIQLDKSKHSSYNVEDITLGNTISFVPEICNYINFTLAPINQ